MTVMSQAAAPLFKRRNEPMSLLDGAILVPAIGASFKKLNPRTLAGNPVMFVVEIVAALTTVFFLRDVITGGSNVVGMHAGF
jgi:high-affinity K+ transport system ATPase subunit B